MAVTLTPTQFSASTLSDRAVPLVRTQTEALATDPAKREAYLEEAKEKYLLAEELAETDPEAGLQAMKELVKKWQTVMRSEDWDSTDQDFKKELTGLIKKGLDFIGANEEVPSLSDVQSNPESAAKYLKMKKKELENIEKNWRSDPDLYGQQLMAHYESMAPLLEPETFEQLDPEVGADVIKHMSRINELANLMIGGTTPTA